MTSARSVEESVLSWSSHHGIRGRWEATADRLAGSDPGWNRLRLAAQTLISVGVAIGLEYVFVNFTGALQVVAQTPSQEATVAAINHTMLVIAMLLGAMVGLSTSMSISDPTPKGQLLCSALVIPPSVASMAFGLGLGGHRLLALTSFPLFLALGGLARRFGPRGSIFGMPLFIGDFIGFDLHGLIPVRSIGWLACEIAIGAAASLSVRLGLFFPNPARSLRRSQRSWVARARRVVALAEADFLQAHDDEAPLSGTSVVMSRPRRRLLTRLNEASLIIDAQLVEPGALPVGSSARRLHERLFEAELGLTNLSRFSSALSRMPLPSHDKEVVAQILLLLNEGDHLVANEVAHRVLDHLAETASEELSGAGSDIGGPLRNRRVLLHRFARSVLLFGEAIDEWLALGTELDRSAAAEVFVPAVKLTGGWLQGSMPVSTKTAGMPGDRWYERHAVPQYVRVSAQTAVAVAVATAAGDALSSRRFYWAVVAALVTFFGTNNVAEQVRKALGRVVATVGGIVVGSLVARAIGTDALLVVPVVLGSLFIGVYLFRISYAFHAFAVTVMVSQLYRQLGELNDQLLVLRLEETLIGALAAIATVLLVLPLRTSRVLAVAEDGFLKASKDLVVAAASAMSGEMEFESLAPVARKLDAAYQALVVTARPLRRMGGIGNKAQRLVIASGALRHYSRNLTFDLPAHGSIRSAVQEDILRAATVLTSSMEVLSSAARQETRSGSYIRCASAWSIVEQEALGELRASVSSGHEMNTDVVAVMMAARDFQLLDGALAELASIMGLRIDDLDTNQHTAYLVQSSDVLPSDSIIQ